MIIESGYLYRDYFYSENLFQPRDFSTENHVSKILQELSLTISQKKLVQENGMKLFSHQKAELGPLLPETPVTQTSKCSKICSKESHKTK